ncbi:MAG TPA: Hsp20/alpha crystallin family protein, partial [Solirubrobacteraceae bacterium]
VAYTSDPPRAIVTAELAGVEIDELDLEIQGRKLVLTGRRGPAEEGEVYQQVEIERGGFRRIVELAADVRAEEARASYEDGMLRVELPLVRRPVPRHAVPIEPGDKP